MLQLSKISACYLIGTVAMLSIIGSQASAQGMMMRPTVNLSGGLTGGFRSLRNLGGFSYGGAGTAGAYGSTASNPYGSGTMSSNPYGSGSGSGTGSYDYPDPYGGYLQGAAVVTNAQGQFLTSTQSAYLLNERVRSAQISGRRAQFEEWIWERANLPTLNDQRHRVQDEQVRRSLNDPPMTEIWSGKALNDLLTHLQQVRGKNVEGGQVAIAEDVGKHINVTAARSGGSLGLLKDEGKIAWHQALTDLTAAGEGRALRLQLDALVKKAYLDASQERTDAGTFKEIEASTRRLRTMVVEQGGDMPFREYTEAKRFLTQLDEAVKVLRQADAKAYINGKYAITATTASELIAHMTQHGLTFAPAGPGEESAYLALHRALVAYSSSTGASGR